MSELRVVLDTSVIVSAVLLPKSLPRRVFDFVLANGVVITCETTILELDEVLRREKFKKYISEEQRLEFVSAFVQQTIVIDVRDSITACRDPKDDKFLEVAISGNATHLISSDQDLLVLHPFRTVEIPSPQAFLQAHGSAT